MAKYSESENKMNNAKILIADDDPVIREILSEIISQMGMQTDESSTSRETLDKINSSEFDVVLLDLKFPDCCDLSTLKKIRKISPESDILLVTAQTDNLQTVAEAIELGAFDYIPKPIREDDIKIRLTKALQLRRLNSYHQRAISDLASGHEINNIIGDSAFSKDIRKKAFELSSYDIPVLITGETGTGKELVARALHYSGPRRSSPFVAINCAALPPQLIESELFGHEKGAFTGASTKRKGAFEKASDGTIFLDEIGDLNLQAQAALLRVLENGEYHSVGGKEKKNRSKNSFCYKSQS